MKLTAELSEKQARSIKYQIVIAKLPFAKKIDEFAFDGSPIRPASAPTQSVCSRHAGGRSN